ncbi:MAG TPA: hypothetical protein VE088_01170 [Gaiellaceae bacterium]|jgi:hypothetical protein|nr:hypothetical protein [Gaiellaceae bacterium]
MNLLLRNPSYTEQLASFLSSLGQHPFVSGPGCVELAGNGDETSRLEVEIYLRVWHVLHPDAEVELAA